MIIKQKDLSKIRKRHKDQKIVYCSGSFDLPHIGHALYFKFCKDQGDILIVNIGPDKDIRRNKGADRPIINQKMRLATISFFKPVDYCFIGQEFKDGKNPFANLESVLKKLRPDIYVINKDSKSQIPLLKTMARKYNFKLIISSRKHPLSTTEIIQKIKNLTKTNYFF